MEFDLLISGAGPAGLCLARALADTGLTIGLVEQQPEEALREAAFDGREIALTQRSASLMRELGLWKRIQDVDGAAFSPLRDARVFNGSSPFAMLIGHTLTNRSELGWLVSNHHIRRAAYAEVKAAAEEHGRITLMTGQPITRVLAQGEGEMTEVLLADGTTHRARLLVAADSRFSPTRRAMGVGASMHDFGRTMLVCQMTHEVPHNHVAWEWFDYGQTLALLPMNDDPVTGEHRASTVLTLPHQRIEPLLTMDEAAFGEEMSRRYHGRLGRMKLTSTRHSYPLVGGWCRAALPAWAMQRWACTRSRHTASTSACSASTRWPKSCARPMPPARTSAALTCWPATSAGTCWPRGRCMRSRSSLPRSTPPRRRRPSCCAMPRCT